MPKYTPTNSSDNNSMYYDLSWEGTIYKKTVFSTERFHKGHFLFGKPFEEVAFCSEDGFKTVSCVSPAHCS